MRWIEDNTVDDESTELLPSCGTCSLIVFSAGMNAVTVSSTAAELTTLTSLAMSAKILTIVDAEKTCCSLK